MTTTGRAAVSIVCVYNDAAVRSQCLDRSIQDHRSEGPEVEYLPIDNTDNQFPTAGAALNHGASLATADYVVFVHQDVYLHSLTELERVAGLMAADPSLGLVGAIGITADGRLVGRIRDRVVLLGDPTPVPIDVDSLDEVLFMIPRRLLEQEPIIDDPHLAWHAYAVEYGLRVRRDGLRVAAVDIPLTHNSLTINLARLDVAHQTIAQRYADAIPVRTTCGTVRSAGPSSAKPPLLADHRWRYTWLKESVVAHRSRRAADGGPVVLSDLRRDIDELLTGLAGPTTILNLDEAMQPFIDGQTSSLQLMRRTNAISVRAARLDEMSTSIAELDRDQSVVLTNLSATALSELGPVLRDRDHILGYHGGIGTWALVGPIAAARPVEWRSNRSRPAGMAALP